MVRVRQTALEVVVVDRRKVGAEAVDCDASEPRPSALDDCPFVGGPAGFGPLAGRMADPSETPARIAEPAVAQAVEQAAVRRFVRQVVRRQPRRHHSGTRRPGVRRRSRGGPAGSSGRRRRSGVPSRGWVVPRAVRLHLDPESAARRRRGPCRWVLGAPWCRPTRFVGAGRRRSPSCRLPVISPGRRWRLYEFATASPISGSFLAIRPGGSGRGWRS